LLIARSLFDLLRQSDVSLGAKPVVRAHASEQGDIELDDAGAFFDIDTPDDYRRALEIFTPPAAARREGRET
jgi:CTP:molybdopterin cytidylyltransferase MocA